MRIHIATVGTGPAHAQQRQLISALTQSDEIGVHTTTDDPAEADAVLIVDLHQHPDDPFLRCLRHDPTVRRYREKTFVLDQRDRPAFTLPGIYVSASGRSRRRGVSGGPYPVLPNAPARDAEPPDLLFSFLGARTHPVRDALLRIRYVRSVVEDTTDTHAIPWLQSNPTLPEAGNRYARIVQRSKFVLCPRGHGPSSFRLYETLSAGRVPVVISDDWLAPPGVDWEACVVRVPESQAAQVADRLEAIEAQWPTMADAAQAVWEEHFSPARLWHHYASSLERIASVPRAKRRAPWWLQEPVMRVAARSTLTRAQRSAARIRQGRQ